MGIRPTVQKPAPTATTHTHIRHSFPDGVPPRGPHIPCSPGEEEKTETDQQNPPMPDNGPDPQLALPQPLSSWGEGVLFDAFDGCDL